MEQTHWAVSLIIAWLPFLLFMGATFWVGHRIGRELKTSDGRPMAEVVEECGRELKRTNDLTAQSVADLRMRLEALEKKA